MKKYLFLVFVLISGIALAQPIPSVVKGTLIRLDSFPSKYVTARNVHVWVPAGYENAKRYAVLYMHDGQMLYDSTIAWNKQAWDVDDVASRLIEADSIVPFIVVGVWNGGITRHVDYFPQKPFENLPKNKRDSLYLALRGNGNPVFNKLTVQSDNYLRFLVKELKPYIDANFATKPEMENTFVAGSSMGGLISLYAICEYPEVFGGAICMSTHWPGTFSLENNPVPDAFLNYFTQHLPSAHNHKIYFDYGTETLDAMYPELQNRMDKAMNNSTYSKSGTWITRRFEGHDHSERAWKSRLHIPLLFMFGK